MKTVCFAGFQVIWCSLIALLVCLDDAIFTLLAA